MSKKTILLVEDNDVNRTLFADIIKANGYDVIESVDGEDAIEIVTNKKIDFIIMDIRLDGALMSGLDAIKVLKGNKQTSAIPVLTLTAYAQKDDEKKFSDAGSDAYLSKPFKSKELIDIIKSYIGV
jgi:two-component system cell cycle response regulator DivK